MPQMSPLLWFNLYIYFIISLIIIMTMIYYLKLFKLNNLNNFKLISFNFKLLW